MDIAFLTETRFPDLYPDDLLAVAALEALGARVHPVRWDTATPQSLGGWSAVVVRSVWDWFHRRAQFRAFLDGLAAVSAPVFNAPRVLRTYADKRYLLELAARGVPTVPTVALTAEQLPALGAVLAAHGWDQAVLKPAFTAGAADALRLQAATAAEVAGQAPALPSGEVWLLQPYRPEVEAGEWSLLFFDGAFSHAVRKVPRAGEWRVQHQYGGVVSAAAAPPALVAQAAAVLALAAPEALYARVDGLLVDGALWLMELEVVEPELFFRCDPLAPGRFARALLGRLQGS
jgi:glutathione synthase/RimK-type ligase-like ATP-grasp enzyme